MSVRTRIWQRHVHVRENTFADLAYENTLTFFSVYFRAFKVYRYTRVATVHKICSFSGL